MQQHDREQPHATAPTNVPLGLELSSPERFATGDLWALEPAYGLYNSPQYEASPVA